jgi:choloylglycine hydrolase
MTFPVLGRTLLASVLSLSMVTSSIACTALSYTDANGNMYVGRTNEYPGMLPDELTYYPVGTIIESVTPEGKKGHTFSTKYAILGATLKGMVANAKQDTLHEAINDHGLSISALEFTSNGEAKTTASPEKILSLLDFPTWMLGNFKTIQEFRQALPASGLEIWLPRIKSMADLVTPVHYAVFDKSGDGIVIEFEGGKIQIYENTPGVLANNPPFPWHLTNLQNYAGLTNIDKNTGEFRKLKVTAPDSGGATRSLPNSNISPDRFVKAAYYANFAEKAKNPTDAILTLSHVMNNFDRPVGITIDMPGSSGKGESIASQKPTSEVTYFTALKDLNQSHFYIRTIKMMNFVKFDLSKLTSVKTVKTVSFETLSKQTNLDGADLFLK